MKNKIIEIKKEIVLRNGNESVILESGDKIMVVKEAYEVAETIRQQIGHKAFFMMGAKDLLAHSDGLSFKIRGSKTYNGIKITLNGRDLYDVHFYKIHGAKITREKKFNDVYVDMLHSLIEEQTGLYLKL